MKKGNGFLSLRCAISLAVVFVCMLWAMAQYVGSGGAGASASHEDKESAFKCYAVVCSGPSNVWLAGDSGTAASVSSIDADGARGLALHDDGSVTCVDGAGSEASEVSEIRFANRATASAAGLSADFAGGADGPGVRRASHPVPPGREETIATAEGGRHRVELWADGSVTCQGDIQRVPARVRHAVAVGASSLNAWARSADGAVDAWGGSFPPGGLRVAAKGPAACEIVDVRVADSGLCLLMVRARRGQLEGDADGDGVPGVEEVFLHGSDPQAWESAAVAAAAAEASSPVLARAAAAVEPEASAVAAPRSLYALAAGTTYYADASRADDSGDGQSWASAKMTIQAAVDLASAGDTVLVTNGVYGAGSRVTPDGLFQNRLVVTNGVLVKSCGGAGVTVIQGSGAECYDSLDAVRCVFIADGVLDGFTLEGGAAVSHWTSPDQRDKSGGCLNMFLATAESEARNCILSGGAAYDGGGVCGGRLVNCVVQNCVASYPAGADRSALLNCTVTANGDWSASCGTRGCGVTNSIVYGNTGWESPNCHSCEVSHSCSDPLSYGEYNISDDVLFADPLFADAANGDFRLQAASPCVDAGFDGVVTLVSDLDGIARVQSGAVDMGAYEFPADADSDGDGIPDLWEVRNGLDPANALDAENDSDADGVSNRMEYLRGTDPRDADSRNITLFADSSIGDDAFDGLSPAVVPPAGRGPKLSVQQAIGSAVSGDVIELRGQAAFVGAVLVPGDKRVTLSPVGSIRF